MASELIPLLTNALGGAGIGAVFGWLSKRTEAKQRMDELRVEKELAALNNDHDLEVIKIRASMTAQSEAIVAQTAQMEAAYSAMEKSYQHDAASYSTVDTSKTSKWLIAVDFIRGVVRPAITAYLVASCTAMAVYFMWIQDVKFSNDEAYNIVFLLVNNLTTCTGLAISWYFAARTHNSSGGG